VNGLGTGDELDPLPFVAEEEFGRQALAHNELSRDAVDDVTRSVGLVECEVTFCNASCEEPTEEAGRDAAQSGQVLDVNMRGIAVRLPAPITAGRHLWLRIAGTESEQGVEIGATVFRCEPSRSAGYQVVCRLDRHLTFREIHDIGRVLFASSIV
jgi:hypothetical protein